MVTDIEEIKCKKIDKFVEKYDLLTHTDTHTQTNRWAGILLVALIRIYGCTSLYECIE